LYYITIVNVLISINCTTTIPDNTKLGHKLCLKDVLKTYLQETSYIPILDLVLSEMFSSFILFYSFHLFMVVFLARQKVD